jgi:hypothetical protein
VPHTTTAYRSYLTDTAKLRQRWLLLGGGLLYAVVNLWAGFRIGAPPVFAVASFQLVGVILLLFGFTFARRPGPLLEINPSLLNLAVGIHILIGADATPTDSGLRSALAFGLVIFFSLVIAPTLRATLAAMGVGFVVAALGAQFYVPSLAAAEVLGYLLFPLAISGITAWHLEHQRRLNFGLRTELEPRTV